MSRLAENLNTVIPLLGDDHEVADMFDVPHATVRRWRIGEVLPPDNVVIAIAARLAIDLDTLRYGDTSGSIDSCAGVSTVTTPSRE